MASCEVCGNEYDKAFEVRLRFTGTGESLRGNSHIKAANDTYN